MKDMKCGETNEKIIFQFLFFELWSYFTQKCKFSMNFHDNSEKKIWKLIFLSIQHNAYLSLKRGQNWGGGDGLHILSWEIPNGQDLKIVNKSLITRKIEIGKLTFYFYSVHCASFSKMGSKLRGGGRGVPGGVCIFLVWTGPRGSYISELHLDWSNWTLKGFFLVNVLMTCSVAHKCSKTLRYHYHS